MRPTLAERTPFYVLTGGLALMFLFPLIWSAIASVSGQPGTAQPSGYGLGNYVTLLKYGSGLPTYLGNSVIVSVLTVVVTLAVSVFGGYAFARFTFPGRNALFLHKHLGAHMQRIPAQIVPGTHLHAGHCLSSLEPDQDVAQRRRNRPGGLRGRVGKHVNEFTGDQKRIAAENRAAEQHRRIAHARALHGDIELVVDEGRRMELHRSLLHIQVTAQLLHGRLVRQRQCAPVIGDGGIEIHQVVRVENDFLHVHFGPAHTQPVGKTKVLSIHGKSVNG